MVFSNSESCSRGRNVTQTFCSQHTQPYLVPSEGKDEHLTPLLLQEVEAAGQARPRTYKWISKLLSPLNTTSEKTGLPAIPPSNKTLEKGPSSLVSPSLFLVLGCFVCLFLDRVSLCNPNCPRTHFVDQADLELTEIFLSLSPKFWY